MHTIIMAKMTKVLNGVADLTINSSSPTDESELRMQSYGATNMCIWTEIYGT